MASAAGKESQEGSSGNMTGFVIPKKGDKQLFRRLDLSSREFQNEILPLVRQSFHWPASENRFTITAVHLVRNRQLQARYHEKKQEFIREGRSDKDMMESLAFLGIVNEQKSHIICNEGIRVGNVPITQLGKPSMGVCLQKHADILWHRELASMNAYHMIVFKIMRGRVKLVSENSSNLEPTPNFDCHVAKHNNLAPATATVKRLYISSQIYLYEYDDEGVLEKPRQICPIAIIHYRYGEMSPFAPAQSLIPAIPKPIVPPLPIWQGQLFNNNRPIGDATLVSFGMMFKPVSLGQRITLACTMSLARFRNQYLQMCRIAPRREVHIGQLFLDYFRLLGSETRAFEKLSSYLDSKGQVAVWYCGNRVEGFLLPCTPKVSSLGFPLLPNPERDFHCVFASPYSLASRLAMARDRIDKAHQRAILESMSQKQPPVTYESCIATVKPPGNTTLLTADIHTGILSSTDPISATCDQDETYLASCPPHSFLSESAVALAFQRQELEMQMRIPRRANAAQQQQQRPQLPAINQAVATVKKTTGGNLSPGIPNSSADPRVRRLNTVTAQQQQPQVQQQQQQQQQSPLTVPTAAARACVVPVNSRSTIPNVPPSPQAALLPPASVPPVSGQPVSVPPEKQPQQPIMKVGKMQTDRFKESSLQRDLDEMEYVTPYSPTQFSPIGSSDSTDVENESKIGKSKKNTHLPKFQLVQHAREFKKDMTIADIQNNVLGTLKDVVKSVELGPARSRPRQITSGKNLPSQQLNKMKRIRMEKPTPIAQPQTGLKSADVMRHWTSGINEGPSDVRIPFLESTIADEASVLPDENQDPMATDERRRSTSNEERQRSTSNEERQRSVLSDVIEASSDPNNKVTYGSIHSVDAMKTYLNASINKTVKKLKHGDHRPHLPGTEPGTIIKDTTQEPINAEHEMEITEDPGICLTQIQETEDPGRFPTQIQEQHVTSSTKQWSRVSQMPVHEVPMIASQNEFVRGAPKRKSMDNTDEFAPLVGNKRNKIGTAVKMIPLEKSTSVCEDPRLLPKLFLQQTGQQNGTLCSSTTFESASVLASNQAEVVSNEAMQMVDKTVELAVTDYHQTEMRMMKSNYGNYSKDLSVLSWDKDRNKELPETEPATIGQLDLTKEIEMDSKVSNQHAKSSLKFTSFTTIYNRRHSDNENAKKTDELKNKVLDFVEEMMNHVTQPPTGNTQGFTDDIKTKQDENVGTTDGDNNEDGTDGVDLTRESMTSEMDKFYHGLAEVIPMDSHMRTLLSQKLHLNQKPQIGVLNKLRCIAEALNESFSDKYMNCMLKCELKKFLVLVENIFTSLFIISESTGNQKQQDGGELSSDGITNQHLLGQRYADFQLALRKLMTNYGMHVTDETDEGSSDVVESSFSILERLNEPNMHVDSIISDKNKEMTKILDSILEPKNVKKDKTASLSKSKKKSVISKKKLQREKKSKDKKLAKKKKSLKDKKLSKAKKSAVEASNTVASSTKNAETVTKEKTTGQDGSIESKIIPPPPSLSPLPPPPKLITVPDSAVTGNESIWEIPPNPKPVGSLNKGFVFHFKPRQTIIPPVKDARPKMVPRQYEVRISPVASSTPKFGPTLPPNLSARSTAKKNGPNLYSDSDESGTRTPENVIKLASFIAGQTRKGSQGDESVSNQSKSLDSTSQLVTSIPLPDSQPENAKPKTRVWSKRKNNQAWNMSQRIKKFVSPDCSREMNASHCYADFKRHLLRFHNLRHVQKKVPNQTHSILLQKSINKQSTPRGKTSRKIGRNQKNLQTAFLHLGNTFQNLCTSNPDQMRAIIKRQGSRLSAMLKDLAENVSSMAVLKRKSSTCSVGKRRKKGAGKKRSTGSKVANVPSVGVVATSSSATVIGPAVSMTDSVVTTATTKSIFSFSALWKSSTIVKPPSITPISNRTQAVTVASVPAPIPSYQAIQPPLPPPLPATLPPPLPPPPLPAPLPPAPISHQIHLPMASTILGPRLPTTNAPMPPPIIGPQLPPMSGPMVPMPPQVHGLRPPSVSAPMPPGPAPIPSRGPPISQVAIQPPTSGSRPLLLHTSMTGGNPTSITAPSVAMPVPQSHGPIIGAPIIPPLMPPPVPPITALSSFKEYEPLTKQPSSSYNFPSHGLYDSGTGSVSSCNQFNMNAPPIAATGQFGNSNSGPQPLISPCDHFERDSNIHGPALPPRNIESSKPCNQYEMDSIVHRHSSRGQYQHDQFERRSDIADPNQMRNQYGPDGSGSFSSGSDCNQYERSGNVPVQSESHRNTFRTGPMRSQYEGGSENVRRTLLPTPKEFVNVGTTGHGQYERNSNVQSMLSRNQFEMGSSSRSARNQYERSCDRPDSFLSRNQYERRSRDSGSSYNRSEFRMRSRYEGNESVLSRSTSAHSGMARRSGSFNLVHRSESMEDEIEESRPIPRCMDYDPYDDDEDDENEGDNMGEEMDDNSFELLGDGLPGSSYRREFEKRVDRSDENEVSGDGIEENDGQEELDYDDDDDVNENESRQLSVLERTETSMQLSRPKVQTLYFLCGLDQEICNDVKIYLESRGHRAYSSTNTETVRAAEAGSPLFIFIHSSTMSQPHTIPNLLQLKLLPNCCFMTFDQLEQLQSQTCCTILEKGGIVVPDLDVLCSATPGLLSQVLSLMKKKHEAGTPWIMLIHSHILEQLENSSGSRGLGEHSTTSSRASGLLNVLKTVELEKVVHFMNNHDCDSQSRNVADTIACLQSIQEKHVYSHRHVILLTEMTFANPMVVTAKENGIGVMTLIDLIHKYLVTLS